MLTFSWLLRFFIIKKEDKKSQLAKYGDTFMVIIFTCKYENILKIKISYDSSKYILK